MGNFGKITIYMLLLGAIFLWFSSLLKSCNFGTDKSPESDINSTMEEEALSTAIAEDTSALLFENDFISDEDEDLSSTKAGTVDRKPSETGQTDAYREPDGAYARDLEKDYTPRGMYMIIAGNYLIRANAETMVDKLNSMGYSSASIVVFERSQYHTVIASRLNDYEEALNISNALKRQGIETYVKRRS